jgi:hypothetical protein
MGTAALLVGLLASPAAPLFGSAAVYYGVRALRQKAALGESDGRATNWVVIVLGVLEIVGGLGLLTFLIWYT